jgi:hypothetical protein
MNIVTPIPTTVSFVTANVNTEAARRDNSQRETIPATTALENSAAETGLGSEADRVKGQSQASQALTYERPQPQTTQNQQADGQNGLTKDNAEDPSAGKENAEDRQKELQDQAEQKELEDLKQRDLEVRAHELAHSSTGGQYSGTPQFEYETGPDGKRYAVGGEVSIDISAESTPEATIRKMQQVKAAALSPAEPSAQDLRVATEATQKSVEARNELIAEKAENAQKAFEQLISEEPKLSESNVVSGRVPNLDDIVDAVDVGIPSRTLDIDPVVDAVGLEIDDGNFVQRLENREENINQRVAVIENFYQKVSLPRSEGFRQSI